MFGVWGIPDDGYFFAATARFGRCGKVVAHDLQNSWRILAAAGIAGRHTAMAAQAWLNHHRWKPGDADTYRFGPELDKMTALIPSLASDPAVPASVGWNPSGSTAAPGQSSDLGRA
jgi:hypothetical protein